jgi:Flp pilus assembly protein TadD
LAIEETVPALDNLALISLHLGRQEAAVELTERADRIAPPTARHMAQQGTVYAKVGRWAEAGSRFRAALAISPDAVTMANLAAVCAHERKFEEAESLYRRALELLAGDPRARQVLWNYAGMLRQTGRKAEARKLEARVRPVPGSSVDVSSLLSSH